MSIVKKMYSGRKWSVAKSYSNQVFVLSQDNVVGRMNFSVGAHEDELMKFVLEAINEKLKRDYGTE